MAWSSTTSIWYGSTKLCTSALSGMQACALDTEICLISAGHEWYHTSLLPPRGQGEPLMYLYGAEWNEFAVHGQVKLKSYLLWRSQKVLNDQLFGMSNPWFSAYNNAQQDLEMLPWDHNAFTLQCLKLCMYNPQSPSMFLHCALACSLLQPPSLRSISASSITLIASLH